MWWIKDFAFDMEVVSDASRKVAPVERSTKDAVGGMCKVPSCMNRAKSRGFCWSHGGGTKCKFETCEKIAISNGLCWAHGGGKRCAVKGCMRQAYERTANLCNNHYQERQHGAAASTGEGDSDSAAASNWQADDEETLPAPPSNQ
ncbi:hypothetical protein BBJ29_002035 [Phytophthora kernoviae]|uniref:WRKY19-like zinc finger domain-containing protein n=1 Tax=Phytophthora kernoviae TaxID=325452 RepID=A0A3F2RR76_9STRA|nr:hypothetical protein BBJ29_002035 [Phytophthora kernoviae]RLN62592.1 hypothetical protein BBP00_00004658 [Phytophthora kernoviae]